MSYKPFSFDSKSWPSRPLPSRVEPIKERVFQYFVGRMHEYWHSVFFFRLQGKIGGDFTETEVRFALDEMLDEGLVLLSKEAIEQSPRDWGMVVIRPTEKLWAKQNERAQAELKTSSATVSADGFRTVEEMREASNAKAKAYRTAGG